MGAGLYALRWYYVISEFAALRDAILQIFLFAKASIASIPTLPPATNLVIGRI